MTDRYFISSYTDGPVTRWNVIDRQTQEWIRRFPTQGEAETYANSLDQAEVYAIQRTKTRPDLSTITKRNVFYSSARYRDMTTAEKCSVQGDGFINDYD